MLGIFLSVLKIIGIVLLVILSVILALILIVLFVAVRYKAKGSFKDNIFNVKANVSYLLHIFCAIVSFDNKLDYYIRLFGIKINIKKIIEKKKAKSVDAAKTTENANLQSDDNEKFETCSEQHLDIDVAEQADVDKKTAVENNPVKDDKSEDDNNPESDDKSVDDNSSSDIKKEKESKIDDIKYYIELIQRDETKEAFHVCKDRLGKAFKSILPYKGKIYVAFGNGDAGLIGEILGFYQALYPYIGKVIIFVPYFTEKHIEVSFDIKGKIRASSILYQIIRIYFDKNCHRLIKILIKKNRRK